MGPVLKRLFGEIRERHHQPPQVPNPDHDRSGRNLLDPTPLTLHHDGIVNPNRLAELIGAHSMDVMFTSCATESNNAAIAAALRANPAKRHIVTSQVEHSSVLNCCMALEKPSQDSPQSTQRSQGTAPQPASVFSVPSVVDGSSCG